jgi:hypothetical protein
LPRKAKPPAVPVEMPRTEGDLDKLATAVEAHMKAGNRIGKALSEGQIEHKEALDQAADADEKLYNTLDAIFQEREEERQEEIDSEQS